MVCNLILKALPSRYRVEGYGGGDSCELANMNLLVFDFEPFDYS